MYLHSSSNSTEIIANSSAGFQKFSGKQRRVCLPALKSANCTTRPNHQSNGGKDNRSDKQKCKTKETHVDIIVVIPARTHRPIQFSCHQFFSFNKYCKDGTRTSPCLLAGLSTISSIPGLPIRSVSTSNTGYSTRSPTSSPQSTDQVPSTDYWPTSWGKIHIF